MEISGPSQSIHYCPHHFDLRIHNLSILPMPATIAHVTDYLQYFNFCPTTIIFATTELFVIISVALADGVSGLFFIAKYPF